jgi:hypothetical protein
MSLLARPAFSAHISIGMPLEFKRLEAGQRRLVTPQNKAPGFLWVTRQRLIL